MSSVLREQVVAVVESFLSCIASNDLERLPATPDLVVQSPLTQKLSGEPALAYVEAVAAGTSRVRIVQHIVEGEHVATLSENDTVNGSLWVFSKFRVESGLVAEARVFYDPRRLSGS